MNADQEKIINAFFMGEKEKGNALMRKMITEHGGFTKLGKKTGFGSTNIHRMISKKGNPTSRNFFILLRSIE